MESNEFTISGLVSNGDLASLDIDAVFIAFGYLSYDAVAAYMKFHKREHEWRGYEFECFGSQGDVPGIAHELTVRICGCQVSDGGGTELLHLDEDKVEWMIHGPCVTCPKIRYTSQILRKAFHFRVGSQYEVYFAGIDYTKGATAPSNSQETLGEFLRNGGLTYRDIDLLLQENIVVTDVDLIKLRTKADIRRIVINRSCS